MILNVCHSDINTGPLKFEGKVLGSTEELSVTVARVETKVDATLARLNEMAEMHRSQLTDHEARIRLIERIHDQVDPLQSRKDLDELERRLNDLAGERHTVGSLVRSTGGIVGWLAGIGLTAFTIADLVRHWKQ